MRPTVEARIKWFAFGVGLVLLLAAVSEVWAHDHHGHGDTINNTTNNYTDGSSSANSGSSGHSDNDENFHGVSIAAAAGTCVRDWTKGMQYCASWAYLDSDYTDDGVHGFGGGITTRVDEFAVSLYGGVENIDKDNSTWLITGSINWR